MKASRIVSISLALAGLLIVPTEKALAQETGFSVQARGGLAIPVGHDLYSDPGASFGGDFTYWVTKDFGLRAAGDVDLLSGAPASDLTGPVDAPHMNLYHFRGGFVFRALNAEASPWTLDFDALGGMSTISIDELPASLGFEESSLSETYAAASGGVLRQLIGRSRAAALAVRGRERGAAPFRARVDREWTGRASGEDQPEEIGRVQPVSLVTLSGPSRSARLVLTSWRTR